MFGCHGWQAGSTPRFVCRPGPSPHVFALLLAWHNLLCKHTRQLGPIHAVAPDKKSDAAPGVRGVYGCMCGCWCRCRRTISMPPLAEPSTGMYGQIDGQTSNYSTPGPGGPNLPYIGKVLHKCSSRQQGSASRQTQQWPSAENPTRSRRRERSKLNEPTPPAKHHIQRPTTQKSPSESGTVA